MPVQPAVLIVDDHEAFRRAARVLLEAEGFTVVGEAGDGMSALAAVERLRPSVVLLDVQLPGDDGIVVAGWIHALRDPPSVVLISSRTASVYGARLAAAPAAGFLTKDDLSCASLTALLD